MSGKGIRGAFKVTGDSKPLTEDAKLAAAAENYQRYVKSGSNRWRRYSGTWTR